MLSLLLLLVGGAAAQDAAKPDRPSPEQVRQLLEQLADDDPGRREEATGALRRAGEGVRKELEEASRSSNAERAGRADRLLWALNNLRAFIKVRGGSRVPKGKPIPAEVRLRQVSAEPGIYLSAGFHVTVWLLELAEDPPQEGRRHHGSFGGRSSSGCALSESDFLKLTPGSEHAVPVDDLRTEWDFRVDEKVIEKYPKISLEAPALAGLTGPHR